MARIRQSNLRREEVDTLEEGQKTFNDVYRILREQQQEIEAVQAELAGSKKELAALVKAAKKETSKKES